MNNADRIRAMTDEELADYFNEEFSNCSICPDDRIPGDSQCTASIFCKECWLDWLKQEAKEE